MPLSYIVFERINSLCIYVHITIFSWLKKKITWIPNGSKEYNCHCFSYISFHSINLCVNVEKSDMNRWNSCCFLKHEQISDLLDQEIMSTLKEKKTDTIIHLLEFQFKKLLIKAIFPSLEIQQSDMFLF